MQLYLRRIVWDFKFKNRKFQFWIVTNRMDTIYKNKLNTLCISARHFTFKICNSQLKIVILRHIYTISYLSDYHAILFVGLY